MQEAILKEYLLCSIGGPKESENTNFKAVDDYAQWNKLVWHQKNNCNTRTKPKCTEDKVLL